MKLMDKIFSDWIVIISDGAVSKEAKLEIIKILEDYEKYHLEFALQINKCIEKLKIG